MKKFLVAYLLSVSLIYGAFPFSFWKSAAVAPFNLGLATIAGGTDSWAADAAWAYRVQASASGTLQSANLYANGPLVSVQKMAVYGPTDASSPPSASDLLIGSVSGTLTATGSPGWVSASIGSGTVVSGQYYFVVCFISSASATQQVASELSTTVYYQSTSGGFASPPANLSGLVNSGAFGRVSAYITAQ